MNFSVVIPTYHRWSHLAKCLDSVALQTDAPREVIVVDNGFDQDTKKIVEQKSRGFHASGIDCKYVKNSENSGASARNLGAEIAIGDLVAFLDDDVVLQEDYYREITDVFKRNPQALGVQGTDQTLSENFFKTQHSPLWRLVATWEKIFQTSCFFEEGKSRVLPSLCVTNPSPHLEQIIQCEWISTCAGVFRKRIFEEFRFDDNLKKYSWNEYLDFSYRIFKKYPKSLFLTPFAKYRADHTEEGRIPRTELIYMAEVYDLYIFFQDIDQTYKNKALYVWSKFGRLIYNVCQVTVRHRNNLHLLWHYARAPLFTLWHIRDIKRGNLEFFNRTLQ